MLVRALKRRGNGSTNWDARTDGILGFFSQQYGINGRPFAFLFVLAYWASSSWCAAIRGWAGRSC